MKLIMYGLSLDESSEQANIFYRLSESGQQAMLEDIQKIPGVSENYIFHDNHSFEVFLMVEEHIFQHGDLLRYFAEVGQVELKDIIYYSYSYFNEEAINHLFNKVYGNDLMSPIDFFSSFIENAIIANHAHSLGRNFYILFDHLLHYMFDESIELQKDYNVATQLLDLLEVDSLNNYGEKDVMILGANLGSLYLLYCLKHYGVRSVTLTEIDDSDFSAIIHEIENLNFNYFNNLSYRNVKLANIDQMNYQFASADLFVNLIVGWSNLKDKISKRISEVRLTPKRVAYAAFHLDEIKSQFDEFKLSLPKVDDQLVRQDNIQAKTRFASENALKQLFQPNGFSKIS